MDITMMVRIPLANVININYFITKIYSECKYSCLTCDSSGCISCPMNSNRTLNTSTSTCTCIDEYYDDGQNSTC